MNARLPAVRNRMEIPEFRPGKSGPSAFRAGDMNVHVAILKSLTNPQIRWGLKNQATLTDGNFLIELSRADSESAVVFPLLLLSQTNPDHFECQQIITVPSGSETSYATTGDTILVAKPFNLRRTPFDGKTVSVTVEAWDGATFSSAVRSFTYEYKSATYRIATDDDDDEEKQSIIPRLVP